MKPRRIITEIALCLIILAVAYWIGTSDGRRLKQLKHHQIIETS